MIFDKSISMFLENEAIERIVMYILDKADDIPFSLRTRKVSVPVDENFFPEIFYPRSYEEDTILEDAIGKLCQYGIFELKCASRKKHLPLVERNAKLYFNIAFEDEIRQFYLRPVKKNEWEAAMSEYSFKSQKARDLLSSRVINIKGKSPYEVIEKFDEWAIKDNHTGTARQESARCFWGLSKVFDNREDIVDAFNLKETLVMLNAYSFSEQVAQVLFIENLDTFNAVIESDNPMFSNIVVVYSSGYKASARRIRKRTGSKMFFEQNCTFSSTGQQKFLSWFYRENNEKIESYFWGDLDYSGIGILIALKENFPNISAWKPGYDPMIKAQQNDGGHSPEMAKKENQTKPSCMIGCRYADNILMKALHEFETFVDQEIVEIEKI